MYTKEMADKVIEHFTKNEYWKEEYENAPSEECRELIVFQHCRGQLGRDDYFKDLEEYKTERERLESKLSLADWKHLLKYSGNNPWRGKCRQKIKELEAANQA